MISKPFPVHCWQPASSLGSRTFKSLKCETDLERVWGPSESHLSPALLHRGCSGKIVNINWRCWDCSAGSEVCLHHAGMLRSLLCTLLPFLRWSLLPRRGNLLNLKLIKASTPQMWGFLLWHSQSMMGCLPQAAHLKASIWCTAFTQLWRASPKEDLWTVVNQHRNARCGYDWVLPLLRHWDIWRNASMSRDGQPAGCSSGSLLRVNDGVNPQRDPYMWSDLSTDLMKH